MKQSKAYIQSNKNECTIPFEDVNSLKECLNVPQNFLTQVCISSDPKN